jgi:hypothetical protein
MQIRRLYDVVLKLNHIWPLQLLIWQEDNIRIVGRISHTSAWFQVSLGWGIMFIFVGFEIPVVMTDECSLQGCKAV